MRRYRIAKSTFIYLQNNILYSLFENGKRGFKQRKMQLKKDKKRRWKTNGKTALLTKNANKLNI